MAACRFGDFTPDATVDDANPTFDAGIDSIDGAISDSGPDGATDAMPDAMVDATPIPDALPPDAYSGTHTIGALGPGLTTLVGFEGPGLADGEREQSLFRNPVNVVAGPSGDVYVADFGNDAIRVVTPEGVTSTLTLQTGFSRPFGMAFTPNGNFYVQTDRNSTGQDTGALWQVDLGTGTASLVIDNAGRVRGLASLSDGRLVLVDSAAHTVRVYDLVQSQMTDIAGLANTPGFVNGTGSAARFDQPRDVVVTSGDDLYIADFGNNRIRFVSLAGNVATLAGSGVAGSEDGNALVASFDKPAGLALENDSKLYITEFSAGTIRLLQGGTITTIAGSSFGHADNADPLLGQLSSVEGIDLALPYLYIADGNGGTGEFFNYVRRLQR